MKRWRVVITTTLNDNLFHAKLAPLLRARDDFEVVVVSDRSGPAYSRVRWDYPRGAVRLLGRLGGRIALLTKAVLHPRTKVVMAYNVIPHGLFANLAARLRGVPLYLHFIAGKAEIDFALQPRISHNRAILRSGNPARLERIARKISRRAARIFVPGRRTAEYLAVWGYPAERITRLHSAVDPAKFYPTAVARDIDVLVVAQLREGKRPQFTLRILQSLLAATPSLRFVWLGDGPLREQFLAWRKELGLESALEWRAEAEVADYCRRSRVYLLCSLSEGLSLSCMEAMACGVVPVVSDCGDMSEVAGPAGSGIAMRLDASEEDFVEAIRPLLRNVTDWAVQSELAASHILHNHSLECATREWKIVLDKLLGPES